MITSKYGDTIQLLNGFLTSKEKITITEIKNGFEIKYGDAFINLFNGKVDINWDKSYKNILSKSSDSYIFTLPNPNPNPEWISKCQVGTPVQYFGETMFEKDKNVPRPAVIDKIEGGVVYIRVFGVCTNGTDLVKETRHKDFKIEGEPYWDFLPELKIQHKCKYCGCITSQSDERCYKNPKNALQYEMPELYKSCKIKINGLIFNYEKHIISFEEIYDLFLKNLVNIKYYFKPPSVDNITIEYREEYRENIIKKFRKLKRDGNLFLSSNPEHLMEINIS